jgi:RNA polymerase sigma factor (sigma-70 family)
MENIKYANTWSATEWIHSRYEQYKTMLFRIAISFLGNKHDCEDILQEAFIRLCYNAPAFASNEDEKRWLIRVTINLCKNHLKSFWNRNKTNMNELIDYVHEPEDRELMREVFRLPPIYRTVIYLYYVEGYKISGIADILKLSESTVKMRLKRGREKLKLFPKQNPQLTMEQTVRRHLFILHFLT